MLSAPKSLEQRWRLDRLARNLRHLVVLIEELNAMGVSFVSLNEGIDLMTPAGPLQLALEDPGTCRAGLARVRAQGRRLGWKPCAVSDERFAAVANLFRAASGGRRPGRRGEDDLPDHLASLEPPVCFRRLVERQDGVDDRSDAP